MANYVESHAGLLNGRLFGIDPRKSAREDENQLTLFDADALANEEREKAIERFSEHVTTARRDHKGDPLSQEKHDHATRMNKQNVSASLRGSYIPTELLNSLQGSVHAVPPNTRFENYKGFYNHSMGIIGMTTRHDQMLNGGLPISGTVLHELGHRADARAADVEGADQRGIPQHVRWRNEESIRSGDNDNPNARLEGFADGFRDRHAFHSGGGYDTDDFDSSFDKAMFTVTRAHTGSTGERVALSARSSAGEYRYPAGEYMYRMLATSPHAREALDHTKGNEQVKVALESAKDYADTRALSIQHPLPLKDSKGHQIGRTIVTRDIPEHISGGLSHDQFLRAMRHWSASGLDQSKFDSR
jgi:hypothetical protein